MTPECILKKLLREENEIIASHYKYYKSAHYATQTLLNWIDGKLSTYIHLIKSVSEVKLSSQTKIINKTMRHRYRSFSTCRYTKVVNYFIVLKYISSH